MNIVPPTEHEIDFDKVETIGDLKRIIKAMRFIIYDNDEQFESLKYLLKDVE